MTIRLLQGFNIYSSFGSLTQFTDAKWFCTLLDRNNDPKDDFHFNLFSPVVIGLDINVSRDIVHINLTSIWFLLKIRIDVLYHRFGNGIPGHTARAPP